MTPHSFLSGSLVGSVGGESLGVPNSRVQVAGNDLRCNVTSSFRDQRGNGGRRSSGRRSELYGGRFRRLQFRGMAVASRCVAACTFLAVLSLLVETGYSIRCYQCNSISSQYPFQCNEFLTSDMDIQPESCDEVYGAQYCVKHIGRFEGGIGTKRFCSSVHVGNYCDYVKQPGDKLTYRTCVFTCSEDGCNSAISFVPNAMYTWIMPASLVVAWKKLFHR